MRACYEAGPTGDDLARLLVSMGVRCEVIAPSMIPKAPGDRVKTTPGLPAPGRLHRAGELVAIRIPTPTEEAVRDLCRTRPDMVKGRTRARSRLTKFLLRHSRLWVGRFQLTFTHEAWLAAQTFSEPALTATFGHYRPWWPPVMPPCTPSRPISFPGSTSHPSPRECIAWAPIGRHPLRVVRSRTDSAVAAESRGPLPAARLSPSTRLGAFERRADCCDTRRT